MNRNNCVITIFGASGDLTKRKLLPALYDLYIQNLLPNKFAILGVSRTSISDGDFRARMKESIIGFSENQPVLQEKLDDFLQNIRYMAIDTSVAGEYADLKLKLEELNRQIEGGGNVIYYLSTPPAMYGVIAQNLGAYNLQKQGNGNGWKRLIVEKPFGLDLNSAQKLNDDLQKIFSENQIYRIDHYLGKETVQNVLVFRFTNGIFEPLWNRNYIDHVEITAAEFIGVEGRGGYYESSGALRDMIQNHLMQVVGLVAMEPPSSFDSTAVRNETVKVFHALRPIKRGEVDLYAVRGQYTESTIRGEKIKSYRDENGVNPHSRTETFAALKFYIDNWRWGGVPFYVRAGKRLPTRVTEVVIHFKETPHRLFQQKDASQSCNQLIIRIQPDEGILLKFGMKLPGAGFNIQNVNMDFHYSDLSDIYLPSAYERLLLDCILGDATLYARNDAVEACWKFVDPILKEWEENPDIKIFGYPAGTWGPVEASSLFEGNKSEWRYPCKNLSNDGLYCEL
jgi:glucose-6-phosphate 1-dehydrogenase